MASELADQVARRMTAAMIASNAAGALVVFVFANFVLPEPAHLHHRLRLILVNTIVFAVSGALACVYASIRSKRLLTELAKSRPGRLLVSDAALSRAGDLEAARFERCDELVLRGRSRPTKVAAPRA